MLLDTAERAVVGFLHGNHVHRQIPVCHDKSDEE